MKIAIVTTLPLFPPYGGSYARILNLARYLIARGDEVDFILLAARRMRHFDRAAHIALFGAGFHFLTRGPLGSALYLAGRAAATLRLRRAARAGGPALRMASVDATWYRPFAGPIARLARARHYDVAIAEYVYVSRALESFPASTFKIIDTLDSHAHEIPAAEERRGLLRADAVLAIQDREATDFRALLGEAADRVHLVSHLLAPQTALPLERTAGATFIGSAFDANVTALRFFIDQVLPLVLAQQPDFRLVVAGEICAVTPDHPALDKLGTVPALAAAFAAAPIAINPTIVGTGVKIKLLEAMSLGVPVVTTAFGADGLAPEWLGGVTIVPDRDPAAFAAALLRLTIDAAHRAAEGAAAFTAAHAWNLRQQTALDSVLAIAAARAIS